MFDYVFAENSMPYVLCPKCNKKLIFHGNYYHKEIVCQNCGCEINLKDALKNLSYPNIKYDKNGYIKIEEEKNVVKEKE